MTTVVMGSAVYGESPVSMVCPYCNATVVTSVTYNPCSKRHITGFLSYSVTFNESDNDKNIDFSKQAGHIT